tara:strand:- start:806 stop:1180 length:375 start_codon:yes stop_codon:yes gene_type:complete
MSEEVELGGGVAIKVKKNKYVVADDPMLEYTIGGNDVGEINNDKGRRIRIDLKPNTKLDIQDLTFKTIRNKEEAYIWYSRKYPDYPDHMLRIISNYHLLNPKEEKKDITQTFKIEKGNYIITFA